MPNCFCCATHQNLNVENLMAHLKKDHQLVLCYFCEICDDEIPKLRNCDGHFREKHPTETMSIRCELRSNRQITVTTMQPLSLHIDNDESDGGNRLAVTIKKEIDNDDDDVELVESLLGANAQNACGNKPEQTTAAAQPKIQCINIQNLLHPHVEPPITGTYTTTGQTTATEGQHFNANIGKDGPMQNNYAQTYQQQQQPLQQPQQLQQQQLEQQQQHQQPLQQQQPLEQQQQQQQQLQQQNYFNQNQQMPQPQQQPHHPQNQNLNQHQHIRQPQQHHQQHCFQNRNQHMPQQPNQQQPQQQQREYLEFSISQRPFPPQLANLHRPSYQPVYANQNDNSHNLHSTSISMHPQNNVPQSYQ